jgi:hypothetical protein
MRSREAPRLDGFMRRSDVPVAMSDVELPSGRIPLAQWERIQQAVLNRGDVEEYALVTLYPDMGEPAEVEAELRKLADWLHDEGLLDSSFWS